MRTRYPWLKKRQEEERETAAKARERLIMMAGSPLSGAQYMGNTGYGEDGRLQPNMPTQMVNTQQGPQMIHEGEDRYRLPDGRIQVMPANQSMQPRGLGQGGMGQPNGMGQQQLAQLERQKRIPGMAGGDTYNPAAAGTYDPFNDNVLGVPRTSNPFQNGTSDPFQNNPSHQQFPTGGVTFSGTPYTETTPITFRTPEPQVPVSKDITNTYTFRTPEPQVPVSKNITDTYTTDDYMKDKFSNINLNDTYTTDDYMKDKFSGINLNANNTNNNNTNNNNTNNNNTNATPTTPPPSPYEDKYKKSLGLLEKYAQGKDPYSMALREYERERFKGEEQAARGGLEQSMGQMGLTGREALTERAMQSRDLADSERELMGGIYKGEADRAFDATGQLATKSLEGARFSEDKRATSVREEQWNTQHAEGVRQFDLVEERIEQARLDGIDTTAIENAMDHYKQLINDGQFTQAKESWDAIMNNPNFSRFIRGANGELLYVEPNWEKLQSDWDKSKIGKTMTNIRAAIAEADPFDEEYKASLFERFGDDIAEQLSIDYGEDIGVDDPRVKDEFDRLWKEGTKTSEQKVIEKWINSWKSIHPDYFDTEEERIATQEMLTTITLDHGLIYDPDKDEIRVDASAIQKVWDDPQKAHMFDSRTSLGDDSIRMWLEKENPGAVITQDAIDKEKERRKDAQKTRTSFLSANKDNEKMAGLVNDFDLYMDWVDTGCNKDDEGYPLDAPQNEGGKRIGGAGKKDEPTEANYATFLADNVATNTWVEKGKLNEDLWAAWLQTNPEDKTFKGYETWFNDTGFLEIPVPNNKRWYESDLYRDLDDSQILKLAAANPELTASTDEVTKFIKIMSGEISMDIEEFTDFYNSTWGKVFSINGKAFMPSIHWDIPKRAYITKDIRTGKQIESLR